MPATDTRSRLLDQAQALIQDRGFNAFSFKDLAKAVGIRTASVHYHFETKLHLGLALMERYLAGFERKLVELSSARTARARLHGLVEAYHAIEASGLACLCGSLATDVQTLPPEMRPLIDAYLERSEVWIAEQISLGRTTGEFAPRADATDLATLLVSALQGALFLGRSRAGGSMLERVERAFWSSLEERGAPAPEPR